MSFFGISLAFDDGWKSALQQAAPLFKQFNIPATFYIISDRLSDEHPDYLNVQDLQILVREGHELGVHTRSHAHLPSLSPIEIRHEIQHGLKDLQLLGYSPKTFAYPYGEYNDVVLQEVSRAGFLAARSIEAGFNTKTTHALLLRAHAVVQNDTADSVIQCIEAAVRCNVWCIVYFYQIEKADLLRERGWIYGSTPHVLFQILAYIHRSQIPVVTVEQGARLLYDR